MADENDLSIEIRALELIVNSSPEGMARFDLRYCSEDHPNWGYNERFKWACWFIDMSKKELEELKKRTDKSVRSPEKEEA